MQSRKKNARGRRKYLNRFKSPIPAACKKSICISIIGFYINPEYVSNDASFGLSEMVFNAKKIRCSRIQSFVPKHYLKSEISVPCIIIFKCNIERLKEKHFKQQCTANCCQRYFERQTFSLFLRFHWMASCLFSLNSGQV